MYVKKCVACGNMFTSSSCKTITCSDECKKNHKKKIDAQYYRNHPRKKARKSKTKICLYCGKEFTTYHNNQVYCNEDCRTAANRRILGRRTFVCAFCGKDFEADARRKYCSAECRRKQELSAKKRSKCKKPKLTLTQAAKLSREEGLTYGQYFAKYGYEQKENKK